MLVKVIFNGTGVGFSFQFFLLWLLQNDFVVTSKTCSYTHYCSSYSQKTPPLPEQEILYAQGDVLFSSGVKMQMNTLLLKHKTISTLKENGRR